MSVKADAYEGWLEKNVQDLAAVLQRRQAADASP
jgi:hypothetical protein